MFRLIKLAIYVGIGYMLYEMFQGMSFETPAQARSGANRGGGQRRMSAGGSRSNPQNMTGPGRGRRVQLSDEETSEGGANRSATVGRGVVR